MAEKCTKQSFSPFSGVMKPKPLASLNHFTVPVVRIPLLLWVVVIGVPEAVLTDYSLAWFSPPRGRDSRRMVVRPPRRAMGMKKGQRCAGPGFFPGTCSRYVHDYRSPESSWAAGFAQSEGSLGLVGSPAPWLPGSLSWPYSRRCVVRCPDRLRSGTLALRR